MVIKTCTKLVTVKKMGFENERYGCVERKKTPITSNSTRNRQQNCHVMTTRKVFFVCLETSFVPKLLTGVVNDGVSFFPLFRNDARVICSNGGF